MLQTTTHLCPVKLGDAWPSENLIPVRERGVFHPFTLETVDVFVMATIK